MLIGVSEKYQIKQIREITDNTLTIIELDETSEFYPFKNWTDTRILSYCYKDDGNSISIYPWVDTRAIEQYENEVLNLQAQVIELEFEKITGGMI